MTPTTPHASLQETPLTTLQQSASAPRPNLLQEGGTDLLARSLAAVWHPCTQMKWHEQFPLIALRRAQGVWLEDVQGKRYLDAISSWWVNLLGHGHPRLKQALGQQMDALDHVMLAGFTHEPVVTLSERLGKLTEGALGHCFYGSDGASATEVALKMSAHYWRNLGRPQKNRFIALAHSYHGETLGALSVTDVPLFSRAYADLLRPSFLIPSPDERLGAAAAQHSLQALRTLLQQHHPQIAALIIEPLVQAAGGMIFHTPAYVRGVAQLCAEFDVHWIADEIAVGFGRTGTLFAHAQAQVVPDFLCLSKGITGGVLPLSVVMTRDPIYQTFYDDSTARAFLHSHSYTGNALACRAALTVLDLLEEDRVLSRNATRLAQLEQLTAPLRAHPALRHYRQRGMIWAFEVVTQRADFARAFHQAALGREVLLRPIGNTVYFMPPYTITDAEFEHLVQATLGALNALL